MFTCYVIEDGWILVGEQKKEDKYVSLEQAAVVRRWSNGKGIGGIAKKENKHEYTLDPIGDVDILESKILFEIPCEWGG